MRKLKLIGLQIGIIICLSLTLEPNSYESNAVVTPTVSYEKQVYSGLSDIKLDVVTPIDNAIEDINTEFKIEEPIAGINVNYETVDKKSIKPKEEITYLWTTDKVNLRSEASKNSDIIITLDKRVKVKPLDAQMKNSSKWILVEYDGTEGYIYSKYLRDTELPSLEFTDEEIEMIQRITEAECEGQSVESKENVVSTVINRMLSDEFPDDVESVIFQPSQFSPIGDKRYFKVEITKDTIKAVSNVLKNGSTHNCLYFCNIQDVENLKNKKWFQDRTFVFKDDSGHSYFR